MKNLKHILGVVLLTVITFTSCVKTENDNAFLGFKTLPSAEEFSDLRKNALDSITQEFSFNTEDGSTTFTSTHGVSITIQGNCLTLDGNTVTGQVDIKYIELFNKGNMLTTNKPTMGTLPNGDKALLISGGEFLIEATKNGLVLETTCNIQLIVPASLTGGVDNTMLLWKGTVDENENLTWNEVDAAAEQGAVFAEGGQYYAFLQDFGWTNIDRFYSDPRPKTIIKVQAPNGYNYTNSAVYLSYDGEDSGLAALDTYEAGLFSEHYGQIPIGLECHIIFITEENGVWSYAIKAVTIIADAIISIDINETVAVPEGELITIINNLP